MGDEDDPEAFIEKESRTTRTVHCPWAGGFLKLTTCDGWGFVRVERDCQKLDLLPQEVRTLARALHAAAKEVEE